MTVQQLTNINDILKVNNNSFDPNNFKKENKFISNQSINEANALEKQEFNDLKSN